MLSRTGVLGANGDEVHIGNLPDQIAIVVLVNKGTKLTQYLQGTRLVAGVDHLLAGHGVKLVLINATRRIISQSRVMSKGGDRIKTKPVNTGLQPKTALFKYGIDNFL